MTTQSHSPAVVKLNMFYKRVILWQQGLHQRTENCRVYKFSGPLYRSIGPLAGRRRSVGVNATSDPSFAELHPRQRAADDIYYRAALLYIIRWPLVARYTFVDWVCAFRTILSNNLSST